MKFLKKNVSEGNAVASVVEKMALSHSEIAFTFIRENKQVLVTSGDGNLKNCIYSVLGSEFSRSCVPVNYELNGVTVKGFVTKPQAARPTRALENFFINGRFVKSRTAAAALEEACKGMVMVGKFPGCVLHLGVSYETVDVNVHPAKIEVRFVNEKPVFEAVYYAVKSAIVANDTVKPLNISANQSGSGLVDKYSYQKPFTMSAYQTEKLSNSTPVVRPSARELPDKRAVKNFINYVVKTCFEVEKHESSRLLKKRKKFFQIEIIDQKLEKLATEVLINQRDQIAFLAKIDEINGLLIDLIT